MKTVAIISEYNPFHNGHLYQIEKIREEFGRDTAIIAIMSGSVTQRGELAILDKWKRAEVAVECGVNLVVELPFPYSSSSAEFFARAGVAIASYLGVVDTLSFGSECGDVNLLTEIAKNMSTDNFKAELFSVCASDELSAIGYPKACELAYNSVFKAPLAHNFFTSNNLLALEYIKALITLKSTLTPHTVLRDGGGYLEEKIVDSPRQSATAIRSILKTDISSASKYIPTNVFNTVLSEYSAQRAPASLDALSNLIISNLCLNPATRARDIHDAGGGLYNRIKNASFDATSISSLIESGATKKYTTARIRRAIINSHFGVTSSDVKELPRYTQVLAMDTVGQSLLKKAKKMSTLELLTKPSVIPKDEIAKKQKHLADTADMTFQLARPVPLPQSYAFRVSPFVKKQ